MFGISRDKVLRVEGTAAVNKSMLMDDQKEAVINIAQQPGAFAYYERMGNKSTLKYAKCLYTG
jgi:hypothetical protein